MKSVNIDYFTHFVRFKNLNPVAVLSFCTVSHVKEDRQDKLFMFQPTKTILNKTITLKMYKTVHSQRSSVYIPTTSQLFTLTGELQIVNLSPP